MASSSRNVDLEAANDTLDPEPLPVTIAEAPPTLTPHPQPPPNPQRPPNPQHPPNPQRRATTTNETLNENPLAQTANTSDVQRDENYGDPSDPIWSLYLTEAEKQDKEVTESWKGDTDGILVFTGLFSATVASFIIQSLQNLSPIPSDTTNALLAQISQQLVNISHGTPLTAVVAQNSQPFKPTSSAIRVNVLWFLSLILSLSCALSATLMQQWARRYQELAQRRGAFHKRGRMRAYIFDGIDRFGMARAVATMPTLLHISVFLFFAGLVEFLFPVYAAVAYATLGCVMVFAVPYTILTVLPNIHLNCPYGTPLSPITWRISQFSAIVFLQTILRIRQPLSKMWCLANQQASGPHQLQKWRETIEKQIEIRRQWFSQGIRKSVELSAYGADSMVVTDALVWTLAALDEDQEIEGFAARVPGFFDSRVFPDATSAILPLMSHQPNTYPVLGSRLYNLLKTCIPETSILDSKMRRHRLRVCMKCLWSFGKAYNRLGSSQPLPSYFLDTLASPEITRLVQAEKDSGIRLIGRCYGALIVDKLATDIDSRIDPIEDAELACLSAFLGAESHAVGLYLGQPGAVNLANRILFMFDEVGTLTLNKIPSDMLDVVQQTLSALSQPFSDQENTELQLYQPIAIINGSDGSFERILLYRLHNLLRTCVLTISSPDRDKALTRSVLMCLMYLWHFGRVFNQLGNSTPFPSDIYIAFLNREVIRRIRWHPDRTIRVVGRCVMALVVIQLAADINARTLPVKDAELAYLSTILETTNQDVTQLLGHPGTIQFANMVFLMDDIYDPSWSPTSKAPNIVYQTFNILIQSLPAQFDAEIRLDLTDTLMEVSKVTSSRSHVMRSRVLGMFLKNLWHFSKASIENQNLIPLPSYIYISFAHSTVTRCIQEKGDIAAYVTRHCVGAMVINNLAAEIDSRTLPVNDAELASLSSILGTDSQDVTHLLGHSGAIQFANMVFLMDLICDYSWSPTLDALDVVQQTFKILTQALPAQLQLDPTNTLIDVSKGSSSLSSIVHSQFLGMCLKSLWDFTSVCIQQGDSVPLPSCIYIIFTHPGITQNILQKGDISAHVTRHFVGALIVNKLATYINTHKLPVNSAELACLLAILGTDIQDVTQMLSLPGAIQFANMVFLMLDVTYDPSWNPTLDVLRVVQQTFSILFQTLPAQLDAEIQLDLTDTLKEVSKGTSSLSDVMHSSVLSMFLKNLWHFTRAYIEHGNSVPLPSYIFIAFTHPRITHLIHGKEGDIAPKVIRNCVGALVVNKLATDIDARTLQDPVNDAELGCLSAILGTDSPDITHLFSHPGAIQFINMIFLASDDVYDSSWISALDVLDVIRRTFDIISQVLPAQLSGEMHLDLTDTLKDVSEGTSSLLHAMRSSVLDMCLKNLWRLTRAYIARGDSTPLPSYIFITFTHPEITCRILEKGDIAAHVTRRCVGALIVNKLASDINSLTDLRPVTELPDDDAELGSLSSILHSESHDVKLCLTQPGVIELVNMTPFALGPVDSWKDNGADNDVPLDSGGILRQTLDILSRALPAQENAEVHFDQMVALSNISDDRSERTVVSRLHNFLELCKPGASPFTEEVRASGLRVSLKTLWYTGKAYHDASDPLPLYFPLMLSSPELTHRFQAEQDQVARVTGCCFGALIASKMVDALNLESPVSLSDHHIHDAELACISAILGTGHREDLLLPHQLRVINFEKVVSLMSGEIDILFTTEGAPACILDMAQDTLNILANRLIDSFVPQGLHVEQQQWLDDISSEVLEVNQCFDDRVKDRLANRLNGLQQILEKLLRAVEP